MELKLIKKERNNNGAKIVRLLTQQFKGAKMPLYFFASCFFFLTESVRDDLCNVSWVISQCFRFKLR